MKIKTHFHDIMTILILKITGKPILATGFGPMLELFQVLVIVAKCKDASSLFVL